MSQAKVEKIPNYMPDETFSTWEGLLFYRRGFLNRPCLKCVYVKFVFQLQKQHVPYIKVEVKNNIVPCFSAKGIYFLLFSNVLMFFRNMLCCRTNFFVD